jgi:vesicle coat complex subunit
MSPLTDTQAIATQTNALSLTELYEVDDHLWLEETVKLLRAGKLAELDIENLIEELESLGKRDRHRVESFLQQIIRHLLMLHYWIDEVDRNSSHWQAEILNFRDQLNRYLTSNLRNHLSQELEGLYEMSVSYVQVKSGGQIQSMPEDCPYSLEQLLNIDYL